MSDAAPPRTPAPRIRSAVIALVALLAFALGLGLAAIGIGEDGRWFAQPSRNRAPAATAPAPAPSPTVDAQVLAMRETTLSAQLAAIEARTASVSIDAANAGEQAGRAEAILIAFAARRAIDRGAPLGYLEDQVRRRFGASQPSATLIVLQAARHPVTLDMLRDRLDAAAPMLAAGGADSLDQLAQGLRNLVVLHRATTPSPLPPERLARARRLIDVGRIEAAVAEVDKLPGADSAADWRDAARRYVAARQALNTLEGTAILGAPTVTAAAER